MISTNVNKDQMLKNVYLPISLMRNSAPHQNIHLDTKKYKMLWWLRHCASTHKGSGSTPLVTEVLNF